MGETDLLPAPASWRETSNYDARRRAVGELAEPTDVETPISGAVSVVDDARRRITIGVALIVCSALLVLALS